MRGGQGRSRIWTRETMGGRPGNRCGAIITAAFLLTLTSMTVQARAFAATHSVAITSPTVDQLYIVSSRVVLAGSAMDTSGVTGVSYEVRERETSQILQASGQWSRQSHFTTATLGTPGATTTTWTATLASLPTGDYELDVQSSDRTGIAAKASMDFGDGPAPTSSSPGYLTLLFGRAQWVAASPNCVPVPGQPTLMTIAQGLATAQPSTPRSGVANVVTGWVGSNSETCVHHDPYPTWQELDALQDAYGWSTVSQGETHADMTTLTPAQQVTESCGSLTGPQGLYAHEGADAWGMFSYANSKSNATIQTTVVTKCFAFGRTYKGGRNVRSHMLANDFQQTNSILGGTCHAWPCAGESTQTRNQKGVVIYYQPPISLANLMNVAGDEWVVVQMYKLVTGTCATATKTCGGLAWNCNGAWQTHWTSKPELYCYNDYMAAVATIPANVITVDPATVAEAWNINPAVSQKPVPVVTSVSPPTGAAAGGTTITIGGWGFTGTAGVAFGSTQAAIFTVDSDTQISVTSPAGVGTVDVRVTTTRGVSSFCPADRYVYDDELSPRSFIALGP
jgi:hypothetical protein